MFLLAYSSIFHFACGLFDVVDATLCYAVLCGVVVQAHKAEISRARAVSSIQQGRLDLAAIYYAQSGLAFDEVALCLLNCLDSSSMSSVGAGVGGTAEGGGGGVGPAMAVAAASKKGANPMNESNNLFFSPGPGSSSSSTYSSSHGKGGVVHREALQLAAQATGLGASSDYSKAQGSTGSSLVDGAIAVGAPLTPLRVFLLQVLRNLRSESKMQRTMVCTWLCDLYLHQISLAKLLNPAGGSSASGSGFGRVPAGNAHAPVVPYEATVKNDEDLDEIELTTQFKNFLRQYK
jgi:hypothetical protein